LYLHIFSELSERIFEDVKLISSMLPVTSISLLLYAAIENLKTKSSVVIERYMSIILTHTLHCQISLKAFISLVEELKNPMQQYLISWLNGNISTPVSKPFKSNSIFQSINRILLNPSQTCKVSANETQLFIEINNNNLDYTPTDFEIKAAFRMVIFYLTQTLQKSNTELENIAVYTETILSLIKIADKKDIVSKNLTNYCAYWILKHPIVLQYFKGVYTNNNVVENTMTKLFINVCSLFFDLNKQHIISNFMHPYQDKFILQLKSVVKKQKSNNTTKEVQAYVELIQLLQLNIHVSIDLLVTIMSLPKQMFLILNMSKPSIWVIIINKLIEKFFTEELRTESGSFITIHENIIRKLFSYWIELKASCKQEIELWENSIYTYLLKFPHSISAVDESKYLNPLLFSINFM
jgi:hypothetical protein